MNHNYYCLHTSVQWPPRSQFKYEETCKGANIYIYIYIYSKLSFKFIYIYIYIYIYISVVSSQRPKTVGGDYLRAVIRWYGEYNDILHWNKFIMTI